ncbi:MAG: HNH endonuclease, partial [Elusimicrobiota bacterium]|nr:HNH endonuclease [Elusimicrobiota bacterium]
MPESENLFNSLSLLLNQKIPDLIVSKSKKWMCFAQKGAAKFAWCLLAKKSPKISVWCLGNPSEIQSKYAGKINFLPRSKTTGEFGKNFQISFMIESGQDLENAAGLLAEVSKSWSRDELLTAYNLYCKTPVDNFKQNNEDIIFYAGLLGKEPKEIVKRFKNFLRLDGNSGDKTDANIDKDDFDIWREFWSDFSKHAYESESKIVDYENRLGNIIFPSGRDKKTFVNTRLNQNLFRMSVLSAYQNKCCITGLSAVELLNASHIMPWAVDLKNRLNPRNGLCLNALHDRAFDRGLITIMPDYTIKISPILYKLSKENFAANNFLRYQGKKIKMPVRFAPQREFLEYHN